MGKRIVILISHKYPYQPPTEVFLHNELSYISNVASNVFILTTASSINIDEQYAVPNGVKCFSIMNTDDTILKLSGVCFAIKQIGVDCLKEIWHKIGDIRALVETIRCYAWATTRYARVHHMLNGIGINPDDEVVVYSYWFGCYSVLASIIKLYLLSKTGCKRVRCISRAHGMGDLYPSNGLHFHPGYMTMIRELDSIYAISDVGRKYLMEEFTNKKIYTYRLGVSGTQEIIPCKNRDTLVIVSCSTINSNKRVDKIAQVIAAIRGTKIKWTHFGNGEGLDKLEKQVQAIMPDTTVAILAGNCSNADICQYYYEEVPDLFINMSEVEGLPVSIMEAMSYSIPVIAPNIGAIQEIIDDKENGYLVGVNDDVDIIRLLIEKYLALTPNEKNLMRERAYTKWEKSYSMSVNYSQFARDVWRQPHDN